MIKTILVVLAVAITSVLLYAATRPDSFRIERVAVIKASPEKVFALVNDFRRWTAWSPWERLDPQLKRTYGGAASGKGAVYTWEGDGKVGAGRMEITGADAPSKLVIQLYFLKPFEAINTAEFTLQPWAEGTTVSWAMYGPSPYVSKLMGVFINMDRMVGGMFEQGLANLKTVAETGKDTK